jgi:hypothetical protein
MATYTKSISNTLKPFGGSPASKWNDLVWGSDYWGDGSEPTIKFISHGISNTSVLSSNLAIVMKRLIANSLSLTDGIGKHTYKGISNTSTLDGLIARKSIKQINNSITIDSSIPGFNVFKNVGNSTALSTEYSYSRWLTISNSFSLSSDASNIEKKAGIYNYVFPGTGINGNEYVITQYTVNSMSTSVYSQVVPTTTTVWS